MPSIQSEYNFIDKFITAAELYPDHIAFEIGGTDVKYTYRECYTGIEMWKGYFQTLNIQQGDRVFILLPEGIEFIFSFYALASIGAISAFYDIKATDYELNQVITEFDPVGIVASSKFLTTRENLIENKSLQFVLVNESIDGESNYFASSKTVTASSLPHEPQKLVAPDSDTIVSCHFTYKGLGYPLQVRHKYHDYSLFLEQSMNIYPQKPGSANLTCLPFYPIYGISSSVLFPLSSGAKLLLYIDLNKNSILNILESYQVSLVCLVPLLLKMLVKEAKSAGADIRDRLNPSLEIISGGSYLDKNIQEDIYKLLGIKVYQGYGLTESFPITFSYKDKVKFGTIGAAFEEFTSLMIVDHDGQPLPTGTVGEIAIKGRTLTEGYFGREEETLRLFKDGYHLTGDLGFVDHENFLYFVGRKQPFTKVTSRMVDLAEVENVLKSHPQVMDARAVVRENKKFGELVYATVKLEEHQQLTEIELRNLCKKYLSKHKIPSKVIICY